ncbi:MULTISPECIES: DUF262 domain-containing protein [unclassified Lactobacillus]|uniref:DUF262 domain-containing protein n=1 Tax=unclassified Lactobacillus TaxID=2620435 RepID=UPI000EFCD66D|nr:MULTISPECIES: DUF262 domain-containing protein [unclassified Lactobacillus]RMC24467.1 DUF262 domain-containing protein [Lactobacillus sp. ESL0247]RMC28606.1 DUF262 domain-containing protein [Lactobacillus sp. ESL0246]RMC31798.1 DUF262 domain-containing protein [Lactobacillus sp. ESL0245]
MSKNKIKQIQKQFTAKNKTIEYNIRDFPIKYIMEEFKENVINIPDYQRKFIWTKDSQSNLVESILLGLPIPMMFFSILSSTGQMEVVDGAQRLNTLNDFTNNDLTLQSLEVLNEFNGLKYEDLPINIKREFDNTSLRIVILSKETSPESRKELFKRINTQGVKANPMEVRLSTYEGPFISFVKKLAEDETFQKVVPFNDKLLKRKTNYEYIIRFFAYCDSDFVNNYYDGKVKEFIDKFTKKNEKEFPKKEMSNAFQRTFEFASNNLPYGFRKSKNSNTVPSARFEALAVGINLALQKEKNLSVKNMNWINGKEFKDITSSDSANNKANLLRRINFVKEKLLKK